VSRAVIVNAITFARVPLIVLWFVGAIAGELTGSLVWCAVACVGMLFSGLTDLWDGALARKWNCVSTLGKMADPLMDKVFYLFAFPTLVWLAHHRGEDMHSLMLLVFTILYLLRDTWVTFMRAVGATYGADVAAMMLGKVRTALSFPGAGWIYVYLAFRSLAPSEWRAPWIYSVYFVELFLAVLTLVSLFTYTKAYLPYLKKGLSNR